MWAPIAVLSMPRAHFRRPGGAARLMRRRPPRFAIAESGPWAAVGLVVVLAAGCGGSDNSVANKCLEPLGSCTPSFSPTYDNIYKQVLVKSCGNSSFGSQCHYGPTSNLAQAGLVLSNENDAYDYLLGNKDGRERVMPGNPECSLLVQRLESKDPSYRMPVGMAPLSEGQRCAIRQWIEQGASRQ